jgi:hypothetical protein
LCDCCSSSSPWRRSPRSRAPRTTGNGHLDELRFRTGESNGARGRIQGLPGRYRLLASASLFRAAGCYAFQIDGSSFSSVVVVRVKS